MESMGCHFLFVTYYSSGASFGTGRGSRSAQPEPVHQWEMKLLPAGADAYDIDEVEEEDSF